MAFMRKETLQVMRDPSSWLVAVIMPLMMIFLFGYGISLDANKIRIGLVLEDTGPQARSLANAFERTRFFEAHLSYDRGPATEGIMRAELRGMVIIPQDFSRLMRAGKPTPVQVIADGSEPNTAVILEGYAEGTVANWMQAQAFDGKATGQAAITPLTRVWFNPELKTRNVILPGAIAIILSLIGTLLTAMVVAREWERGTMEAMMATSIRIHEMIIAKLVPYFLLGIGSLIICLILSIGVFGVPFRGSLPVLLVSASLYLFCALLQGLLISTAARSQFVAGQIAGLTAFLPAFMLSGFLFEINSMPKILQWITYLLPHRYFVAILQTEFVAGNIWPLVVSNMLGMAIFGAVLFAIVSRRIVKRLD